jgi:hypothetical protein
LILASEGGARRKLVLKDSSACYVRALRLRGRWRRKRSRPTVYAADFEPNNQRRLSVIY